MYQKIITVSMSSPKTICFYHFNLFSESSTRSTKSAMVWFLLTQLFWTYKFLNIKLYYFLIFVFIFIKFQIRLPLSDHTTSDSSRLPGPVFYSTENLLVVLYFLIQQVKNNNDLPSFSRIYVFAWLCCLILHSSPLNNFS